MYFSPTAIRQFITSEDGPTAVEYAVLIGFLALAVMGIIGQVGTSISGTFNTVSSVVGSS